LLCGPFKILIEGVDKIGWGVEGRKACEGEKKKKIMGGEKHYRTRVNQRSGMVELRKRGRVVQGERERS